jgi:hypothetical protein
VSRIALVILKGRNEEKVRLSAEHLRAEFDKLQPLTAGKAASAAAPPLAAGTVHRHSEELPFLQTEPQISRRRNDSSEAAGAEPAPALIPDLVVAGPTPAPLARAETFYRYQIMLRTRQMTRLSQHLARLTTAIELPDDVSLVVDIDPVDMA